MRVMLDARSVDNRPGAGFRGGGIALYVTMLVEHLLAADPTLRLRLIVRPGGARLVDDPRVDEVVYGPGPQSLRALVGLSRAVSFEGVDLFHAPANVLPLGLPTPAVATVHDVMWLVAPHMCAGFPPKRWVTGTYYRVGIGEALRRSARILTVSETSRAAIRSLVPEHADRVRVTSNALDPCFAPLPRAEAEARTATLVPAGTPFVLVVGQGSPYKNHPRAVRAFLEAFADHPAWRLVLVRRLTRLDSEMRELMRRPESRSRLIPLPTIGQEALRDLYGRASIFLFPSLYEGFGLPILEAMACGCPVVTSAFGAPREVAGEAAVLVNPCQVGSIAEGLRRLRDDVALRQRCVAAGLRRAGEFSWAETARRTLAAYEEALGSAAPGPLR